MERGSFILRLQDQPGEIRKVSDTIAKHSGNINRVHYDHRIDTRTVFLEITASKKALAKITSELKEKGILLTGCPEPGFLKIKVHLPHRPGALREFLEQTAGYHANINYMDFDDSSPGKAHLTLGITLTHSAKTGAFLEAIQKQFSIDVLEYDTNEECPDHSIFYMSFARELRSFLRETDEPALLSILSDINHAVQEHSTLGADPEGIFTSILRAARQTHGTTGKNFYADVQRISLSEKVELFCFQLPTGGNCFVLNSGKELITVDTGFGIYHEDIMRMLEHYGFSSAGNISRMIISHADADHCGATGYFNAPVYMHADVPEVVAAVNRAYGSISEDSILEQTYTRLIELFTRFLFSKNTRFFSGNSSAKQGIFPVIGDLSFGDLHFQVLESLGGHQHGQIFLFEARKGIIFSADTIINFKSITEERKEFMNLAVFLIVSVNVNSETASEERKGLYDLADGLLKNGKEKIIICGGHGAVSFYTGEGLNTAAPPIRYTHTGD